jgi:hypothetical protein
MTESEKDVVVGRIVESYTFISEMLKKEDSSPPNHVQIEAMLTMLYGSYEVLTSPPSILVVACKIAQHERFTPSTVKVMLNCLYKMLEGRFGEPGIGKGKDKFKFE